MCDEFFTPKEDGLKQSWTKNFIFNPPFAKPVFNGDGTPKMIKDSKTELMKQKYESCVGEWVQKAYCETLTHKVLGIGILPLYTTNDWFHDFILEYPANLNIVYLRNRIKYKDPTGKKSTSSPNFDSILVYFDGRKH